MSASPVARQVTQSQAIPRRVVVSNSSQLPNDYSTTPGGTIYSTTPGGTRIVYDRSFLMQLRNSPMAKTPPRNIQCVPGGTGVSPVKQSGLSCDNNNLQPKIVDRKPGSPTSGEMGNAAQKTQNQDEQFQMDL